MPTEQYSLWCKLMFVHSSDGLLSFMSRGTMICSDVSVNRTASHLHKGMNSVQMDVVSFLNIHLKQIESPWRRRHKFLPNVGTIHLYWTSNKKEGKSVPLQARSGPEGSRNLSFPDFVATAQDGGRLSALRTGRLCPQEISWYSFLFEAESTPGP